MRLRPSRLNDRGWFLFSAIILLTGCTSEKLEIPVPVETMTPLKETQNSQSYTELEPYRDVTTAEFKAAFEASIGITGQSIPDWRAFSKEVTKQSPSDLQVWACLVRAAYQARSVRYQGLESLDLETADRAFGELQQALEIDRSCVDTREYVAVRSVLASLAQHASMINTGLWKKINQYPLGASEKSVLTEQTIAEFTAVPVQCVDLLTHSDSPVDQQFKEYSKQTFTMKLPADFEETNTEPDSVLSYYNATPSRFHTVMILCGRDVNFKLTDQMKTMAPQLILTEVADQRMKRIGDSIVCSGTTTVCDVPARYFHTRRIRLDARLIACQIYLFIRNEDLYVMSFHCDADQIEHYRDLFSHARTSFQFLKK